MYEGIVTLAYFFAFIMLGLFVYSLSLGKILVAFVSIILFLLFGFAASAIDEIYHD